MTNFTNKYRYLKTLIIILILYSTQNIFAQTDKNIYFEKENKICIKTFVFYNSLSLKLKTPDKIELKANNPFGLGVSVALPKLPIELRLGFGVSGAVKSDYPKTKHFDVKLYGYGKSFFFESYFLLSNGFIGAKDEKLDYYPIKINQFVVNGQYVFNNKRFSIAAAYNQKYRQLKSAGSFLLGANMYLFRLLSDEKLFDINKLNVKSGGIGFNIGYSYSFVYKHLTLNLTYSAGLNIAYEKNNSTSEKFINLHPITFPKVSMFYNTDKWAIGFTNVYHTFINTNNNSSNQYTKISSGRYNFTVIWKI